MPRLIAVLRLSANPHDSLSRQVLGEFSHVADALRGYLFDHAVVDGVEHLCTGGFGAQRLVDDLDSPAKLMLRDLLEQARCSAADVSLAGLLHEMALDGQTSRGNLKSMEQQEAVRTMTVHAAKGLEFRVVFVIGLEEGAFPSSRCLEESQRDPESLEAERRLCYVALTRAKQRLVLTCSAQGSGAHPRRLAPSRFLLEVPKRLMRTSRFPAGDSVERHPTSELQHLNRQEATST